jgi:hypothetical protein
VAATGREVKELDEYEAMRPGCFSALRRVHRCDRLSREKYLCEAAARSGRLEELKALPSKKRSWVAETGEWAAFGDHLEVLK